MKKLYLALALFISTFTLTNAQIHLQSAQLIEDFNETQIDSFLTAQGIPGGVLQIRNSVKVYKIIYSTVSYDSSATVASGVVFLPQGNDNCKRPILNYCHGTIIKKVDAPSNKVGEYVVGICFSATGYITILPDYLGLGSVSPGLHPYIHAQSEATSVIDMIRASKEWMDSTNYSYSDKLFLTGYSQGGHASMATHRMMQETLPGEFTVTAAAPLSGPYDVSGVQAEVITRDSSYGAPGYLPFVLFSYNMVYNMYNSWNQILDTPYCNTVPPLMDGSVSLGVVENFIPDTPNLILIPALLDTFETDTSHVFWDALRANNLYDWVPTCPVRMGYCTADELVSYKNAIACQDSMIAHGATDVQAFCVNPLLGHSDCALYALMAVNGFFNNYRDDLVDLTILNVTNETSAGSNDGSIVTGVTGGVPGYSYLWNNGNTTSNLNNVPGGPYTVTVTDSNGCASTASAFIGTIGIENEQNPPTIHVYPNPATDQFTIQLINFKADMQVSIIDMVGKVAVNRVIPTGTENISLNTYGFAKGVYLVKINSGIHTLTKRIVIQ
jgi:acetyl esterase/lipase